MVDEQNAPRDSIPLSDLVKKLAAIPSKQWTYGKVCVSPRKVSYGTGPFWSDEVEEEENVCKYIIMPLLPI